MTLPLPARWAAAGLAGATAAVGLPLLAAASSSPASAQQAPAACSTSTPSAAASTTASPLASASGSASPSPTTGGGLGLPTALATLVASLDPRPASATPTSTTSATPTASTTPCPTATASASATPTATTSATPSRTPTATPTATTAVTPSSSAPATSAPPTPNPTGPATVQCTNPAGLVLDRSFTIPGAGARATVTAPAGAVVELQAYSRPSTTYQVVRTGTVPSSGQLVFALNPGTNTRLFANCVRQTASASAQRVLNVRTALSLTVVRNGRRDYTFQGRLLPRRSGQLITLYRVQADGTRIVTNQIRSDATGTYRIRRVFTGSGTFGFLTRTGQTLTNAAGESNTRDQNSGRGSARRTAIF